MSGRRILVDTSIWIDYFKNRSSRIAGKLDEMLIKDDVCVPKIVIAELIQGAKSEREISVIEEFVEAFNILDQRQDTWTKAGRLSFTLKRKGKNINLSDCYIAVIAQEYDCEIFTLDVHFKEIQRYIDINLVPSS
ncbi:MAG TPA: PIN domain-containing protein [Syntrophales bacterium]|nr:PIN domain-containing protein [Syntrophales bacterium]